MFGKRPYRRQPVAAGRFYDDDRRRCAAEARRLCAPPVAAEIPEVLYGAMVPHAGWVFSGRTAGLALAALAARTEARTFVLTGSVHTARLPGPALDSAETWATPLGEVPIDVELRDAIAQLDAFAPRDEAHRFEHSLEVELPLMQTVFGEGMKIVPCLIPPRRKAVAWGAALGRLLLGRRDPIAVIASSDLTHYGPRYGFSPRGVGPDASAWAHETNDRELLSHVERLDAEASLAHALEHHSACGGGAIAAAIAACRALGAQRGYVLEHTDSSRAGGGGADSVGYAGVVFG
ncbi:MAG: AmmeMemoRadiSam system protein B [Planctomycetota bacterium]|nr:AmmeMemoRadiSam system protein B [Planctomycetota bacterium]